jgi:HK97 family phage major capsid protein
VPYNNAIARGDINEVPADLSTTIIQNATQQSAALKLLRNAKVSKRQNRFPVLAALPTAYWVNGDTGLKQTTQMAWANKVLNIEELAVIVPIPENVLDDADFDIMAEVRPHVEEAIGYALDSAVFFGTNAPSSFPTSIVASAIAAGNVAEEGTNDAAHGGIYGDLDDTYGLLETDGFDATGWAMDKRMKGKFRKARNTLGDRQDSGRVGGKFEDLDGDPITFLMPGVATATFDAVVADWSKFIIGLRSDMTYKLLTEAVIQDNTGTIIYNLAQQDMVALRVVFRAGWEFANPITRDNANGSTRYPAAVLQNAS